MASDIGSVDSQLGCNLADFVEVDYLSMGLLLFTIRNGNYNSRDKYPKGYAEKIMVIKVKQVCRIHFHWMKRERVPSLLAKFPTSATTIMTTAFTLNEKIPGNY